MPFDAGKIEDIPLPERLIVPGHDAAGLRPDLRVGEGDTVSVGQPLARDRKRSWLALNSPCNGTVLKIVRGPRRRIDRIEIAPEAQGPAGPPLPAAPTREALIEAGLWSDIRSRPFGGSADPGGAPAAVLVTGFFSDPEGPDPAQIMDDSGRAAFDAGLRAICGLADCGAVLVLAGADPTGGTAIPGLDRYRPRGRGRRLGSLVRRFGPATPERPVWHVDWQAVLGIGRLLAGEGEGKPWRRFVTLRSAGGSSRVARVHVGTPLADIQNAIGQQGCLVVGAPALFHDGPALGRFDDRLSLLRTFPAPRRAARPGPIIPLPALEAELPQITAPALLLRALAAGDDETSLRLGALDLGPEDLAACTPLCSSGNDYAALLTRFLDRQARDWETA